MAGPTKRDPFGFLLVPSVPETAQARMRRKATVRFEAQIRLARLFGHLKAHLGASAARRLFDPFTTVKKSRRTTGRGASNPAQDHELLDKYDLMIEASEDRAAVPRLLATELYDAHGGKFGSSAEAIEKHVRRLVAKRGRERAASTENEREMRTALDEQEHALTVRISEPKS